MGDGAAVEGWMNNGRRVSQNEEKKETYDKSDQDLDGPGLLNNKLSDSNLMIDRCEKNEPDPPERGQWSNPCDFFISCLGYAVGLGMQMVFINTVFIITLLQVIFGGFHSSVSSTAVDPSLFPTS